MTTQTASADSSAQQARGTHHFVITLEKPGLFSVTQEGTFTPPPGSTRQDAYRLIYRAVCDQDPDFPGASVGFFTLEPNQL
ncbi:hypothetical protein RKE30_03580 [Streptomyces sp. Li-HN-5-11]|uniref:hypothetical protein n=1 Tax=Streptomyces sp. Li-HN-5-11 TaxID=3075432 RepID=UPI0028A744F4|nr:hypothetical protein [Streptomyces sp. Li-HN-5-11]WNM29538.1 hypothetical protein RKE30_03580 [Streptomyces sp. Li-HN-5-11]